MDLNTRIKYERKKLYNKYVTNSAYYRHNKQRIDYVLNKVYNRQLKHFNWNEERVLTRLRAKGIEPKQQVLIPIVQQGGKIQHLYIADLVVGNTIIEVDGPQHDPIKDKERDRLTATLGYDTIRIPTTDLSDETIDNYLIQLY